MNEERKEQAKGGMKILARVGIAAYGLVHLLIGWLAIRLAINGGGEEADNSGALAQLGQTPLGAGLLWLIVAGLAALAAWQLVDAVAGADVRDKDGAKKRATHAGRALSYAAMAFLAGRIALGAAKSSSKSQQEKAGTLLSLPGGQILLGLAGVVLVAIGISQIVKGAKKKFTEDLDAGATTGRVGSFLEKFGMVGWIAKGIAMAIAGLLVIWAAVTVDPNKATGVDGALKTLASQPFGTVLLVLVGLGFVCFGLYCFGWARSPRLTKHHH